MNPHPAAGRCIDPVERAARIIAHHDGWECWDDLTFNAKEGYRKVARSVFEDFVLTVLLEKEPS